MNVGDRIKKLRIENGLTLEELANKTGYKSKTAIFKIENGKSELPINKIKKFVEALNTTESYLLGYEERTENESLDPKVGRLKELMDKFFDASLQGLAIEYRKMSDEILGEKAQIEDDDPLMVVAAHHKDYDFSQKQLEQIDNFINFVKEQEKKEPPQ